VLPRAPRAEGLLGRGHRRHRLPRRRRRSALGAAAGGGGGGACSGRGHGGTAVRPQLSAQRDRGALCACSALWPG
jgi:hypothetical protein